MLIVEIVEVSTETLVEDCRSSESERTVRAGGETTSVDGTCLRRRTVELELTVGNDGTDAAQVVNHDTVSKLDP